MSLTQAQPRLAVSPRKSAKRKGIVGAIAALALAVSILLAPNATTPAHATGQLDTFCAGPYGTTVWTGRDPYACNGTLTGYIDGTFQGSVNIVRLIAMRPGRTQVDLNKWCGENPFYCTVAVSGFFFLVGLAAR